MFLKFLDKFSARIASYEQWLILGLMSISTIVAVAFYEDIFERYPVCEEDEICIYQVPVYEGENQPPIVWSSEWRELAAFAEEGQYEMVDLLESGKSGDLQDPMMVSGFIVAIICLWMALPLDSLYRSMIAQLRHDALFERSLKALVNIERLRRRLAWGLAFLVSGVMVLSVFGYFDGEFESSKKVVFLIGSSALGIVAGHRLGSGIAYGSLSRKFQNEAGGIPILPGHADKSGGWKRLSEFFAYELILMLIPIIWISTWVAIGLLYPGENMTCYRTGNFEISFEEYLQLDCTQRPYNAYLGWLHWQLILFLIAAVTLYAGFLRPFIRISGSYRSSLNALRRRYDDALAEPMKEAVGKFSKNQGLAEDMAAIDQIGKLSSLREEAWKLPAIPMRSIFTGAFTLSAFYPIVALALAVLLEDGDDIRVSIEAFLRLFSSSF